MKLRTVLFWTHLTAGSIAGIIILIMSATGTLLTFQQTVLQTIERSQRFVTPPTTARLDVDTLLQRVRAAFPDAQPTTLTLTSDPAASASVALGTQGVVFVNPYTGEILGTGAPKARAFYRALTNWHRWLAAEGEHRAAARAVTGACNAAFLVLAVSGMYLWWPRQWTMKHVSAVTFFRRGLIGKARDFNWHNVIGFWCAPVLVVLTASGMVMSYAWANNLVYTLSGSPRPAPARGAGATAPRSEAPRDRRAVSTTPVPLESLVARAEQRLPTWQTMTIRLPPRPDGLVSFTISDREHWNSFARSTLSLNGVTGAELSWDPYPETSRGQKLRGWIRFAHTGELGGRAGELVAGLASAGGVFLVWTGVSLALRRFAAWRTRRRPARDLEEAA